MRKLLVRLENLPFVLLGTTMLLSLLATSASARVILMVTPSIELQVRDAPVVVRGRIKAEPVVNSTDRTQRLQIEVLEVLKGAPTTGVLIDLPLTTQVTRQGEYLVPIGSDGGLFRSAFYYPSMRIYRLDGGEEQAYTLTGTRVRDGQQIMAVAREAVKFPPDKENRSAYISANEFPDGSDGNRVEHERLAVPADGRLEQAAIRWLGDVQGKYRALGVRLIGHYFHSPGNLERLTPLLDDPAYRVYPANGWESRPDWRQQREYYVRRWVQQFWKAGGPNRPPELGPHPTYVPVSYAKGAAAALSIIVLLSLCFQRSFRLKRIIVSILLLLGSTVAVAALLSRHHPMAISFATSSADYEITSSKGAVSILRTIDSSPSHAPVINTDASGSANGMDWYTGSVVPERESALGSLYFSMGNLDGPVPANSGQLAKFPYRMVRLPHWMLAGVLMLYPAWNGLAWMWTIRLRRRRLADVRCVHCGYDLRHSSARCPECGGIGAPISVQRVRAG